MKASVIWIDREHAKIFEISDEKMERKNVTVSHNDHHTHHANSFDHQRQENQLFVEVASLLKDADKLLILGPGIARHHFQNYLTEHQPALSRKVAGCETMDHPTDPQIAAFARKYFEIGTPAAAK
jgi:stalled ribosome rescue protein Dom34